MVNIFKKVNLLTKSNYSISFCMLTQVCFGLEGNKIQHKHKKLKPIETFFPNEYLKIKKKEVIGEFREQIGEMKKIYKKLKKELKDSPNLDQAIENGINRLGYTKLVSDAFLKYKSETIAEIVKNSHDDIYILLKRKLYGAFLNQIKKEEEVDFSGEIGYINSDIDVIYDNDPRYEYCGIVGKGGFSVAVLGAIKAKENGKPVYRNIKVFKFSEKDNNYYNEVSVLSGNVNKNVINLSSYGTLSEIKDNDKVYKLNREIAYLGLEYSEHGDLFNFYDTYLKKHSFTEAFLCYISGQLVKGLTFLHRNNICHYDIKPGNILIDTKLNVKITDFSISFRISNNADSKLKLRYRGTEYFMAPEVVKELTIDKSEIYKTDVFSFGVMLYSLFTFTYPYSKDDTGKFNLDDVKIDYNLLKRFDISVVFKDFLEKCLTKDYKNRPSSFDLLGHPFIKSLYPVLLNLDENMNSKGHFAENLLTDCYDYTKISEKYEYNKDGQLVYKEVKNEDNNIIKLEESEDDNIIEDNIDKDGFKIPETIKEKDNNIGKNIIRIDFEEPLISLNKDKKVSKKDLSDNKEQSNIIRFNFGKSLISINNVVYNMKENVNNVNNDVEIEEDIKEEDKKDINYIGKKRELSKKKLDDDDDK